MAYDEALADELREILAVADGDLTEKKMFGGICFMVGGKMAIAASRRGGLLVRTDPADADEVLALPGTEPMEMRGRQMPGWVHVDATALRDEVAVEGWVSRALAFVATLPPK
ncbi:MAG TPA: TfoX/Sxy family protein [Solirubrobacterales bacterium]|nr:TfoX/Sxy family protein [Solirubrobacterales bacterium]